VIGICGGYQMLGRKLIDEGFESVAGTYDGLGLLDGITHFSSYDKTTTQVTRTACAVPPILAAMGEITGYEIHMGTTEAGCDAEALHGDGRVSKDGLVFGTYLHGLFQNPSAVNALLGFLYRKKELPFEPVPLKSEDPYEVLADLFEQHVDMDAVQRMLTL
jgi:adenosylcobyric acid synthase